MNVFIKKRRVMAAVVALALVLILVFLIVPESNPSREGHVRAMGEFQTETNGKQEGTYGHYASQYSTAAKPDKRIRIEGESFSDAEGAGFEIRSGLEGVDGKAVYSPESGSISWRVQVEQAGLYHLRIHYLPVAGKSSAVERQLKINGKVPFHEADILSFDRVWGNREEKIQRDDRNNEIRPRQVEKPVWQTVSFQDREGYYEDPYAFYFENGPQTITLTALREPMVIDYMELYPVTQGKTYEQVQKEYEAKGFKPAKDQYLMVQAEQAVRKSSPTLYPLSDRSSPSVIPYHISKLRINTIGGLNWKLPGQWIEWEVAVEQDGLYQIALKRKQDQLRGVYATRSLTIDGQTPFEEMKRLRFGFQMDWKTDVLGGEEPYLFYLTKGTHQLRLTVALGETAPLIRTVQSSILELNDMYRKILMITSNSPDPYRDYQLEKRIPGMVRVFEEQAEQIGRVADYLEQATGERSDKVAVLHSLVQQLNEMAAKPDTVPRRLDKFKVNVGGLGTWILTVREQPLTLDYLVISSPGQKLPQAKPSALQKIGHELGSLFASYKEDYDSIGNVGVKQRSIDAWITTGRDQAQVMKALIDETFTPDSNISVRLRLVPANILLPATLAGEGPDVAMQIGEDVPVNYAMRSAAANLKQFADYDQVASRFRDSALTPYSYHEGIYALPEQQTFPMMFYRKDILQELGLKPPQTWQEIYNMISVLQKHNMQFYLPVDAAAALVPNATFSMLLYQNGGEFYRDGGKKSALDTDVSMDAFKKWTQFYTSYKFPLTADFPNRFRIGEMPVGIADYTTYNMLTVMAPEIKGLWDFTIVPGTALPDASINHTVASHTTGVLMLENAKDKEAAWEFMKWWTSKDTQIAYGREMEGLMGEAARYPTANMEALEQLPWPVKDYMNLESQWQWVKGIPQVPGGYFTGRHLDNAFRKVVNASQNPREALSDYILYINDEISIKRQEFKLPQ